MLHLTQFPDNLLQDRKIQYLIFLKIRLFHQIQRINKRKNSKRHDRELER